MHELTEVTVSCLPKNLPEAIEVDLAELLAETIRRIAFGESVSSLYVD